LKIYDNHRFQFSLTVQPSQPNLSGREYYHGEPLISVVGTNGQVEYISPPELQDLREYEPTPFEIDFMDRKEGGIGEFIAFDLHTEIYDAYSYVRNKSEGFFGSFFGSTQADEQARTVERVPQMAAAEQPPRQPSNHTLSPGVFAVMKPPSYSEIPCEGAGVSPHPPVKQERTIQQVPLPAEPSKGFLSYFGFGG
jgi:hypothetical protein